METTQYLPTREAAAYIGMRPQTLAKWRMDARHLPFVRVGGAVRYRVRDLEKYLESRTVPASTSK